MYLKGIQEDKLPRMKLIAADRYNEYAMTGLWTIWGVSLIELKLNLETNIWNI
jgi:hypothetical protein